MKIFLGRSNFFPHADRSLVFVPSIISYFSHAIESLTSAEKILFRRRITWCSLTPLFYTLLIQYQCKCTARLNLKNIPLDQLVITCCFISPSLDAIPLLTFAFFPLMFQVASKDVLSAPFLAWLFVLQYHFESMLIILFVYFKRKVTPRSHFSLPEHRRSPAALFSCSSLDPLSRSGTSSRTDWGTRHLAVFSPALSLSPLLLVTGWSAH